MFRKVCSKHRYLGLLVLFCFYTDWGGVGLGRGMGRNSFPFRVDPFSRFLTRVASLKVFQFPLKKKKDHVTSVQVIRSLGLNVLF